MKRRRALDKVWDLAEKQWKYHSKDELGEMINSREANTRVLAVLLLEHLLDHDFANYFGKVREEILRGRHGFIETLKGCWFDRCSGLNYRKVQSFVKKARRGLSPGY